jgi:hypothetical protein
MRHEETMSRTRPVLLSFGLLLVLQSAVALSKEPAVNAGGNPDPRLVEALRKITRETLSFADAVRPAIDRAAFEQDALLDHLDYDDVELARFVSEQIAYEPYAGSLRGAHGTLLARAGNALDQSLLLATLLNDAGFEAVIRRGTLTPADARRLLGGLARRPGSPAVWDEVAFSSAFARFRERLSDIPPLESVGGTVPPRITRHELGESIRRDSSSLLAALASADVRLGTSDAGDEVLREARAYFWVDYRTGPAAPWQAVHAAFGGDPPAEVGVVETYSGTIPPELTHRVRLQLFVDQRVAGDVRTAPLMGPMEFPSANVAGQSLSLVLLPDTLLRRTSFTDNVAPAAEARFLVPFINQGLPAGAMALALNGIVIPPDLIQVSQTGVFETVGQRFESAASALRGLGASKDASEPIRAIDSVRLQLTLVRPDGSSRTVERFLYKAPERVKRDPESNDTARRIALVSELARSHSLGFASGGLVEAYVIDEEMGDVLRQAPLIRAMLDPAIGQCDSLACLPRPEMEARPSGDNVATQLAALDRAMPAEPGSVTYRDAPNVIRVTAPLLPTSSTARVFDIMTNSRRAFRLEDGMPEPAPDLVLQAGVAETHIEAAIGGVWAGTPTVDNGVANGDHATRRVWNETPPMAPDAIVEKAMVAQALSDGALIVPTMLPRAGSIGEQPFGWWEIDPVTGRTLGMTRDGGAVLTEFLAGLTVVGMGGALGTVGACFFLTLDVERPPPSFSAPQMARRVASLSGPRFRTNVTGCTFCAAAGALRGVTGGLADQSFAEYYRACMERPP